MHSSLLISVNMLYKWLEVRSYGRFTNMLVFGIVFEHVLRICFRGKMLAAPLVEAGEEVEEDYYLLWRMEQGVAEGSTEIPKG